MKNQTLSFRFHVLERKQEEKRQTLERLRLDTLKRVEEALEKAATEIHFREAYLFGSITKPGHFGEESDIDVGFYGLRNEDFFRMMSFLALELGREVDVVQLEGHRFEGKIRAEGVQWKRKNLPS